MPGKPGDITPDGRSWFAVAAAQPLGGLGPSSTGWAFAAWPAPTIGRARQSRGCRKPAR
jgi:hypothetical protein